MQHTCQLCGYESPVSARFCRQCGAPHFTETEGATATTRNYGRQDSGVAAVSSGHLPPSIADALAGETERYYQPPPSPAPPIATTAPIKSRRRVWVWMLLPFILLLGMALGAMITGGFDDHHEDPMSFAGNDRRDEEEEARQRQNDLQRELAERQREAQERIREAQDRAREALQHAREAAEQANAAGAALTAIEGKPLDLSSYEYPNSTVANLIRIAGHEMLTQRTTASVEEVGQFYEKKLGKPIMHINEPWETRLIFQSSTTPPISVSIEKDEEHEGQLKITVLRSPFRALKLDESPPK